MTLESMCDYISGKIYDAILPKAFSLPIIYDLFSCVCIIVIVFSCYCVMMNRRKYVNYLYFSCMFYSIFRFMSVIFR